MVSQDTIRSKVKAYMVANFLFGDSRVGFTDGDSFIETGVVDSTGVLMVVEFIQDTFKVKVEDAELTPENLDSIDNLVTFIGRKLPS